MYSGGEVRSGSTEIITCTYSFTRPAGNQIETEKSAVCGSESQLLMSKYLGSEGKWCSTRSCRAKPGAIRLEEHLKGFKHRVCTAGMIPSGKTSESTVHERRNDPELYFLGAHRETEDKEEGEIDDHRRENWGKIEPVFIDSARIRWLNFIDSWRKNIPQPHQTRTNIMRSNAGRTDSTYLALV